jgi:hypothetical protein
MEQLEEGPQVVALKDDLEEKIHKMGSIERTME